MQTPGTTDLDRRVAKALATQIPVPPRSSWDTDEQYLARCKDHLERANAKRTKEHEAIEAPEITPDCMRVTRRYSGTMTEQLHALANDIAKWEAAARTVTEKMEYTSYSQPTFRILRISYGEPLTIDAPQYAYGAITVEFETPVERPAAASVIRERKQRFADRWEDPGDWDDIPF